MSRFAELFARTASCNLIPALSLLGSMFGRVQVCKTVGVFKQLYHIAIYIFFYVLFCLFIVFVVVVVDNLTTCSSIFIKFVRTYTVRSMSSVCM